MRAGVLLALVFAGCGGAGFGADDDNMNDAPAGGDADTGCTVAITYAPSHPIAAVDAVVRVKAEVVNAPGVQAFTWTVRRGAAIIPTAPAQPDNSEATFAATVAGNYDVFLDVQTSGFCPQGQQLVEVKVPGAGEAEFRFHVVAPLSANRPPVDEHVIVQGGPTDNVDDFVLGEGQLVDGVVRANGTPIAAYLKFAPQLGKDAPVESFSDSSGAFTAFLRGEAHDVLVVPASSAFAPRVLTWVPGTTALDVDAGTPIGGVVRDQANLPLAGATVQLVIGGVPTTYAVTDATGAFTVRGVPIANAVVVFDVTAPPAKGLPRITLASSLFDLTKPIVIRYSATTIRDLAGTVVRRAGSPLANAEVTLVGRLTGVATITAGVGLTADGELRQSATANGSGVLPALRAPAAAGLSAVVVPAPADFAVTAVDLTAGVPAAIDALAMVPVTTRTRDPASNLIGNVAMDAIPIGPLQLAGAPTIRATSNATGTITTSFTAGAQYQLRFLDPGKRGALLVVPSVTAGTMPASNTLPARTLVTATVKGASPIPNASVQVLCASCTGLDRSRPIAEGVTGIDGRFSLAVPDPTN